MTQDSDRHSLVKRRNVLKASAGGLALLAGCTGDNGNGDGNGNGNGGGTATPTEASTATPEAPAQLTMGTPGEGSLGAVIGTGFARVVDQSESPTKIQANNYSGSEEAVRLIGRDEIDLATANTMLGVPAHNSTNPVEGIDFTGDKALDTKPVQVFGYTDLRAWWLTMSDSDIETTADFAGKTLTVGPPGVSYFYKALLGEMGIIDEVETVNNEFSDVPFAVKEGRVDASFAYNFAGQSTPGWHKNLESSDVKIIPYAEEHIQNLQDSDLFILQEQDVSQYYQQIDEETVVQQAANPYVLQANPNSSELGVYNITKDLLENADETREFHNALALFEPEYAVNGLATSVPVHPGAARYLKEEDLWRDELTVA